MSSKTFQTWKELQSLTEDDLVELFDEHRPNTGTIALSFIREEIAHRRAERQFEEMHRLTRTMTRLTWFLFWFTLINVIAVLTHLILAVCRAA